MVKALNFEPVDRAPMDLWKLYGILMLRKDEFDKMNENNTRQLESNGSFQKSVRDAHDFQRKEHEKMVLSLQEVTLTLKGMNGRMSEHV